MNTAPHPRTAHSAALDGFVQQITAQWHSLVQLSKRLHSGAQRAVGHHQADGRHIFPHLTLSLSPSYTLGPAFDHTLVHIPLTLPTSIFLLRLLLL